MRAFGLIAAVGVVLSGLSGPVFAAPTGTAMGVNQGANAAAGDSARQLAVGSDIFIGDRVMTDANGQVEIKFTDSTKLVVGPNSALTVDDYLIRTNNTAGKFAVNALAGTFRFVTGGAPKDRYVIKTPTGTIGVRGTAFDFIVDANGTRVLLFHGSVSICNTDGTCATLNSQCEVGEYDPRTSQVLGFSTESTGDARAALKSMFPYAENQSPLNSAFRVENARQCLNRPFDGAPDMEVRFNDPSDPPEEREVSQDDSCAGPYNCDYY